MTGIVSLTDAVTALHRAAARNGGVYPPKLIVSKAQVEQWSAEAKAMGRTWPRNGEPLALCGVPLVVA